MRNKEELRRFAEDALQFLESQPGVIAAEVFVASNGAQVGRFNYSSAIPCNGLEEPKGTSSDGLGTLVVFKSANGIEVGFGSEEGSLGPESMARAFKKACIARHFDPEFHSLPLPSGEKRTLSDYHDPDTMELSPEMFCDASWRILDGAIDAARSSQKLIGLFGGEQGLKDARLIVGGDLTMLQERMAVVSSVMRKSQTDESTLAMASLTCMVEKLNAKGSGYGTWTRIADVDETPGRVGMENAIASIGGRRVPSGKYTVIFGPAAMAEIMGLILGSLDLNTIYSGTSLFNGKLGSRVAAEHVQLLDWGNAPGLVASKGITCEGLPTGQTQLIRDGVFVGALANWYEMQRMLHDPRAQEKLGQDPNNWKQTLVPRNGFRFAERGGGRTPSSETSSFGTNVILTSSDPIPLGEMITQIGHGLLLGRLWYVYPMGPPSQGDFTGTVVADSYLIENGRIVGGLAINSLRINDNLQRILHRIQAISRERQTPLVWAADSVRHMPHVLVDDVQLEAIAGNVMETGM
ncbi:MAG: hypothetical protein HYW91_01210 [Candidatus Sungbacteria bacterium]|nr:hypothetical protein [Candidatus Sungbacteria bacterium]